MESVSVQTHAITQLTALAHPRRLAIFRLLMRRYPDAVPAGEIAQVLELPPSSLSAALSQLLQAGLIRRTRAGTSLRYAAETSASARLIDYLAADCCRGRPSACGIATGFTPARTDRLMPARTYNVLFICTGNSARSIFAETLLREEAGDRFVAYSAGTRPNSALNPFALELLRSKGHDVSPLRAKNVDEFQGDDAPRLDFVFTVCDRAANEECPPWPGQPITGHWGQPDPVKVEGTEAEKRLAFQQVYGALRNRIRAFTALPFQTLDRASLQAQIDDLAKMEDTA